MQDFLMLAIHKAFAYNIHTRLCCNIICMSLLAIIESILAVLLILVILVQNKSAGLGSGIGGESQNFSFVKGQDSFLTGVTVAIAVLFFAVLITDVFFL